MTGFGTFASCRAASRHVGNGVASAAAKDRASADTGRPRRNRLFCSPSTIEANVRAGLMPKPELIGNLPRWDFAALHPARAGFLSHTGAVIGSGHRRLLKASLVG